MFMVPTFSFRRLFGLLHYELQQISDSARSSMMVALKSHGICDCAAGFVAALDLLEIDVGVVGLSPCLREQLSSDATLSLRGCHRIGESQAFANRGSIASEMKNNRSIWADSLKYDAFMAKMTYQHRQERHAI